MTGEEAQCLQHELNHMGGLLILDTVSLMKKEMWLKKANKKGIL
jgi:peptide deformylase